MGRRINAGVPFREEKNRESGKINIERIPGLPISLSPILLKRYLS